MWESLVWVWGSEYVLGVREFCVGFSECVCAVCGTDWCGIGGDSLCCVRERLVWICGIEFVLCVGEFGVGLGE